jgi:TusA-related sulfurtransferase
MRSDKQLDIRCVAVPYCLLLVKATLATMEPGTVLEVQVHDPDSIDDLVAILVRSGERIVSRVQRQDGTRLWVEKGGGARARCLMAGERATND